MRQSRGNSLMANALAATFWYFLIGARLLRRGRACAEGDKSSAQQYQHWEESHLSSLATPPDKRVRPGLPGFQSRTPLPLRRKLSGLSVRCPRLRSVSWKHCLRCLPHMLQPALCPRFTSSSRRAAFWPVRRCRMSTDPVSLKWPMPSSAPWPNAAT